MIPTIDSVRNAIETMPMAPQNGLPRGEMNGCGEFSGIGSTEGIKRGRTHVARIFLAVKSLGLALIVCGLPSGCASYAEVTDLKGIQDTAGFFPKAMYYCGSTEICHFFEHETPLADLTPFSKHVRTYMVSRRELRLPDGAEFLRSSYTGQLDTRRQKMKIQITQRNPNRGVAEYPTVDYGQ